jgi:phosphoserine phosphatase RsbU/P
MPCKPKNPFDFFPLAEQAAEHADWQRAAQLFAQSAEQRAAELALVHSVQGGLSDKMEIQDIYELVGDKLRDTFNAQVVMISQYDPLTQRVFHHYAIEEGQHLRLPDWLPIDSSRAEIVHTRQPFMIGEQEIIAAVKAAKMKVVPGTKLPKTWLGVPMLVGNQVRGIVSLQNLDKENAFTPEDINLLMTLTSSMSMSLENARLFSERERLLKQMEAEMQIARKTQRSILPMRLPRRAGYDFGALIIPARAVGGDFYDFIHLDRKRLGLVIGDVSDKGLPAALFMALTFSLLRAESERTHAPEQILVNVNRSLLKMNASGMFVTLIYAVLDYASGKLRYARAGHPMPIVLDAHGARVPLPITLGQPLGILPDIELDVQETHIPSGGLALFFSDGLSEASDPHKREFGLERIQDELHAHQAESAHSLCRRLWQAIETYTQYQPVQDDFTALVVKRDK